MHDDDQIEEFMGELYDKFYPQVMEGLANMQAGDIHEGIEALSRPLHTIKGVTGFMGGFEDASSFTHKVESFLKKIQAGTVALTDDVNNAAITSVNMIFQVIEQIKETGTGPVDDMESVINTINDLTLPKTDASAHKEESITLSIENDIIFATITVKRIHVEKQRAGLIAILEKQGAGVPLVIDISDVLTIGSATWETIMPYSSKFPIHIIGMRPSVSSTFHYWGYNNAFKTHADKDAFFCSNAAALGGASC